MADRKLADRALIRGQKHSEDFDRPQAGAKIWPLQYCPMFHLRHAHTPVVPNCFFCQYGYFSPKEPDPLAAGTCCYPKIQHY